MEFNETIRCTGCGADMPILGRAPDREAFEKHLETHGMMKVGDSWLCMICSGSLPALLSQRPDLAEWFARKARGTDGE